MSARKAALWTATEIAQRLVDPDRLVSVVTADANRDRPPGMAPRAPWSPLSLSDGYPGLALLFAELAYVDDHHRRHAHAHLAAATGHLATGAADALYAGLPALAFAARCARRGPGDYANLLDRLDQHLAAGLRARLAAEKERLDAGRPGMPGPVYDVIGGICGVARYVLGWLPSERDLLLDSLTYLVRLTEPVTAHGHVVPGWWVLGPPALGQRSRYPHGHFNLGLAHGVPGVMALLALAVEAGVEVDGQAEAVARIAGWVLDWRVDDCHWPSAVPFDVEAAGGSVPAPANPAWCYGTAGVTRALFLAGRALDRADWRRAAVDALSAAVRATTAMADCGLCHGWAGLLHTVWRTARDSGDRGLAAHLPGLADRVLGFFDPAAPFGYRSDDAGGQRGPDRAGFLEGAAGIALALHAWATDDDPATDWERALLLR
ncbi:lanthionine synthetase C family protein [Micromonospora sp. NPDC047074]|uniref:lanthionine synthetase C family protein n=1 Tax=Micromonospora sp. NPDC047074 TaxID=3154339 RepID=UPI0033DB18A6